MTCKVLRTLSIFSKEFKLLLEDRLISKAVKTDSCWLFRGISDEYGKLRIPGISGDQYPKTHVVSYLLFKGDIPAEIDVAHSCNVKGCVNPSHLYLATRSVNTQHAIRDGLQYSRLSDGQVKEIRRRYMEDLENGYALAKEFGIDQQIVSRIGWRKAFQWVI